MIRTRSTMMMRAALALIALMVGTFVLADEFAPAGYDMHWFTMDNGGGVSVGNGFEMSGTIGQLDAHLPMSGNGYDLGGGYWYGAEPMPLCPEDVAPPSGDGLININDLLFVISQWGQPGGPADINNDNTVNLSDLLMVIAAWGIC